MIYAWHQNISLLSCTRIHGWADAIKTPNNYCLFRKISHPSGLENQNGGHDKAGSRGAAEKTGSVCCVSDFYAAECGRDLDFLFLTATSGFPGAVLCLLSSCSHVTIIAVQNRFTGLLIKAWCQDYRQWLPDRQYLRRQTTNLPERSCTYRRAESHYLACSACFIKLQMPSDRT